MKKSLLIVASILCLLLCTGCTKKTVPDPEVEAYLNTGITAQKAYDAVAQVDYTVTQSKQNKAGEESGSYVFRVSIDKTDAASMRLNFYQQYFGDYVEDGVTERRITVEKVDGAYRYTTVSNGQTKTEQVDDQFVTDYITSFFYVNNNAYNEGGLYYGDFFMLYIYKYPATSFSVNKQTNQCIFNEKMNIRHAETGEVHLHQISTLNPLGLLDGNYERYESVEKDMVLLSELKAEYVYF